MRFSGKCAFVTGAGSGIGRATAVLLAREGAQVLATDVNEAVFETAGLEQGVAAALLDAGREDEVQRAFADIKARFGGVDIIVANAGVSGGLAGLFDQTEADWARILQVNLIGPALAIKHGAQAMLDSGRHGAIICIASVAGLRSGAGGAAYSASKAGVINLTQTAAQQLSGSGIRVNAVCPGLIETGMTKPLIDMAQAAGRSDTLGLLNPLRRIGRPEEIASAIAFLASDEASYINGHALVVDGGFASSHPMSRPAKLGMVSL